MYLAYTDESGGPGYNNSLTKAYALSTILVHDQAWLQVLDEIIAFRRFLRSTFGLEARSELKASYLIHNNGPFAYLNLGDRIRMKIYRMALRMIANLEGRKSVKVFSVVVDKDKMRKVKGAQSPDIAVWQRTVERLERFTHYEGDTCAVFPDEGNYNVIRGIIREKRRISYVPSAYGTAPLSRPASFLVEDPSMRESHNSYFVQLADLVAYAAHRVVYPQPYFDGRNYAYLGNARVANVSGYTRGTPAEGILLWPPN